MTAGPCLDTHTEDGFAVERKADSDSALVGAFLAPAGYDQAFFFITTWVLFDAKSSMTIFRRPGEITKLGLFWAAEKTTHRVYVGSMKMRYPRCFGTLIPRTRIPWGR